MLEGRDPQTGEGLDDENIRNQCITFLIAGHETTSGLLSFAIYFLLKNPDVVRRARAEVDEVLGRDARADVRADPPTDLRHAGPQRGAAAVADRARVQPVRPEDTVIGGRYRLPAGTSLIVMSRGPAPRPVRLGTRR